MGSSLERESIKVMYFIKQSHRNLAWGNAEATAKGTTTCHIRTHLGTLQATSRSEVPNEPRQILGFTFVINQKMRPDELDFSTFPNKSQRRKAKLQTTKSIQVSTTLGTPSTDGNIYNPENRIPCNTILQDEQYTWWTLGCGLAPVKFDFHDPSGQCQPASEGD